MTKSKVKGIQDLLSNPEEIEKKVLESNGLSEEIQKEKKEVEDEYKEEEEEKTKTAKRTIGENRQAKVVIQVLEEHHKILKLVSTLRGITLLETINEVFEEYIEKNSLRQVYKQFLKIKKKI